MKNNKIIIAVFIILNAYGLQAQSIFGEIQGGFTDNFTGRVGLEVNNIQDLGDSAEFIVGLKVHYRYDRINQTDFNGANANFYLNIPIGDSIISGAFLPHIGINGSYLFKENQTKFILEPELGMRLFAWTTVKATYNLSNDKDFFNGEFNRWGFHLAVHIPIIIN